VTALHVRTNGLFSAYACIPAPSDVASHPLQKASVVDLQNTLTVVDRRNVPHDAWLD
jgi:hypothetical protein